ncbi:hypothetical protein NDI49_19590 [Trichocoleus sp. ST-U3]
MTQSSDRFEPSLTSMDSKLDLLIEQIGRMTEGLTAIRLITEQQLQTAQLQAQTAQQQGQDIQLLAETARAQGHDIESLAQTGQRQQQSIEQQEERIERLLLNSERQQQSIEQLAVAMTLFVERQGR